VVIIKTFTEIYNNLKENFLERTNIDISPRSAIDMFLKSVSDIIQQVYQEIENNKNFCVIVEFKILKMQNILIKIVLLKYN
jgi:hypothetical protein